MVISKMGLIKLSFLLVLFLVLVPGLKAEVPEQVKKGLTFYAPMDGSVTPKIAQGEDIPTSMAEWVFEEGKIGQGLKVGKGSPEVSYYCAGNLLPDRGTLVFWMKLWWDGNSDEPSEYKYFFGVGGGPVVLIDWFRQEKRIFFSTFRDEWCWGPAASMDWINAGKWHFFVFTWTRQEKKIYIDGIQVAQLDTAFIPVSYPTGSFFSIGCHPTDKNKFAEATFDEIMIWDRTLNSQEVSEFYKSYQGTSTSTGGYPLSGKEESSTESSLVFKRERRDEERTLLFDKGEEIEVNLQVINNSSKSQKATTKYEIFDYHDECIDTMEKEIQIPENGLLKDRINFKTSATGIFKIRVTYKTSEGIDGQQDIAILGILPARPSMDEKSTGEYSPFGIHTRIHPSYNRRHLSVAKKLGMEWVRMHNFDISTWWSTVEPERGKFNFSDEGINLAKEYRMNILGLLAYTPYWASTCPETTPKNAWAIYSRYPAKDIKDWEEYVTAVVNHYKDRIKYWEVWNEADISNSWSGTPEQYTDFLKVAYLTAKKVDPSCKILGGGALPVTTKKWIERVCKAGGLDYMDIFVFHGYGEGENLGAESGGKINSSKESLISNNTYFQRIDFFRDLMKKYGKVKPIWDTEAAVWGATYHSNLDFSELPPLELRPKESPGQSASELIKLYVINLAKGIEKIFYYYMEDVTFRYEAHYHTSLFEYDGSPTSRLMAYATLTNMLHGARYKGEVLLGDGVYCYLFEKKDSAIAVIWSEKGEMALKFGDNLKKFRLTNIMCNDVPIDTNSGSINISNEPIFLSANIGIEPLFSILNSSKLDISESITQVEKVIETKMPVRNKFFSVDSVTEDRLFFIDITNNTNMGFADEAIGDGKGGWADEGPMNDMKDMPLGKQYFAGVPFNIIDPKSNNGRSCLVLRGTPATPGSAFPEKVVVKIDKKVEYLYFLHSAAWCGGNPGREVGKYIIDYSSGKQETISLLEGHNILDWYTGPSDNETSIAAGVRISDNIGPESRYLRVLEWKNPSSDSEILTVTFMTNKGPTLILLSITGIKM